MTEAESKLFLYLIFHPLCFCLLLYLFALNFFLSLSYKAFPASFSTVTCLSLSTVPSFASVSTELMKTLSGLFFLFLFKVFIVFRLILQESAEVTSSVLTFPSLSLATRGLWAEKESLPCGLCNGKHRSFPALYIQLCSPTVVC